MNHMMQAIFATSPGGPEVLQPRGIAVPAPAAGEVLIRVAAAGVNRPDLRQRQGGYPPPPGITEVLGLEVAGEIVSCGQGVRRFSHGDKVCALVAGGGYAEYCVAPEEQVLPWPSGLTAIEAAAIPETFFTVWTNLFQIGRLAERDTVLIHGGASGIGTAAIQLARAFGAKVYATAGTDEKCRACRDLGATEAINYKTERFEEEILRLTEGRGVDVILDMICAEYLERNLASLAVAGRLVIIAFLGGGQAEVNIEGMIRKRQSLCGSTLRPQTPQEKGLIAADLQRKVWPLLENGTVKPVIHSVQPLDRACDAHAELEAGGHVGKIVLSVG
ncbi:putative NAD(P)H quinone oxidoreductase, PIG3 family [Roseovarius litoreus]|uniref:Putative NAD(P)H quinone oxidoreductase, PIG3 family n=1 Tax=Roseovarius litoreus TaxID=1155722 RepID=A0A1M7HXC8_9RHOB|nr:NAD(P)H-quinone oxidoreductase [Roseovarius litoreus]SHM33039.1 putative NAD(P)H quinone oxidoreductase, PIG3 family [Roseovarius litoreus]